MRTKKRQYLDALMAQPVDWIKRSAMQPNKHMTQMDVKLHYLAIRKKAGTKQ